jgi:hypothetical protein
MSNVFLLIRSIITMGSSKLDSNMCVITAEARSSENTSDPYKKFHKAPGASAAGGVGFAP